MVGLHGTCHQKFSRIREMLEENVENGSEVGVSLFVNIDGEDVIDLWGGWRDREHTAAWTEDTIVNIFSGSKTVTSLAVLMLVDRGLVDLEAPVARYWPEFAQNGKEGVLVRHLISHTAGLPAWEPPFQLTDAMDIATSTAKLAAQAPWWVPGTRGSYHASTFGHLNAELVRRVTGKTLSAFIASEIAGPLSADFYLGLTEAEMARTATVYPAPDDNRSPSAKNPLAEGAQPSPERIISDRTRAGSFSGAKRDPLQLFNSPEWRRTEFGGSSGHANARGLGRILTTLTQGGVSHGVRLLSAQTTDLIFREQANGIDAYYMKPIRWGVGYALASQESNTKGPLPFLQPSARTCFWYGTGGSLAIADVGRGIAYSYVMNQCQSGKGSLNGVYYKAFYDCL